MTGHVHDRSQEISDNVSDCIVDNLADSLQDLSVAVTRNRRPDISEAVDVSIPIWEAVRSKRGRFLQRTQSNMWMEWIPSEFPTHSEVRNTLMHTLNIFNNI